MGSQFSEDPFEKWQYISFKILLFILFLITAYKFLDKELHLTKIFSKLFSYLRGHLRR
jgi:hypothetical protein